MSFDQEAPSTLKEFCSKQQIYNPKGHPCRGSFLEFYSKDLDRKKFERQLNLIPDFIAEMKKGPENRITSIRIFAEMFKTVPLTFTLYSEVLKLYSTLLINTAKLSADRSFSALR